MSKPLKWGLGFMAVALVLLGAWLFSKLEFVTKEIELPPRGEAARDPFYAARQLFKHLGAEVKEVKGAKSVLPPAGRILYLDSAFRAGAFERDGALERWVAAGGHLVVSSRAVGGQADEEDKEDHDDEDGAERPHGLPQLAWISVRTHSEPVGSSDCGPLTEGGEFRHYPDLKSLNSCIEFSETLSTQTPQLWSLKSERKLVAVRVKWGQGTVTVFADCGCGVRAGVRVQNIFSNRTIERADHALMAAALLQAGPGREVWLARDEPDRPGFVTWLWQQAWMVVVLAAVAVAGGLWREARRFGPRIAPTLTARRSMVEQIQGNAQFLRLHDAYVLHGAVLQALERAAKAHIRGYADLTVESRAKAISTLTGLPADDLAQALLTRDPYQRQHGPELLHLLETARRRLSKRYAGTFVPTPDTFPSSGDSQHANSR